MQKNINGNMLRKMLLAGASLLEENRKYVDSLNVFPVPDGDTGTNMSLTMKSVVNEVNNCPNNTIESVCEAFAKGALKGARGNSGVILSQILRGMSTSLREDTKEEITSKQLAAAINRGAETAYKAVTKPKEGTILTVIRMMAEKASNLAKKKMDVDDFLKEVINQGEETLKQTPEMLPVLKKAGVVDSGGRGLIIIFTGFYKCLINDETLKINYEEFDKNASQDEFGNNDSIVNLEDLGDIQFAYCTEFMVVEMKKKTTEADIDKLREKLMEIGDSVICVGDLSLVKVHVHTNTPNVALGYALELGELTKLKIENMLEQNRELKRMRAEAQTKAPKELKPYGIVSVVAGDGLSALFKDIGVDYCIEGGQTMNPSADDIAKAIDKVDAKDIFILPNNKNIILAAEQSKSLVNDKNIHVIPTASVPEGISSSLVFNPDVDVNENIANMVDAIKSVKSSSVTYAVRTTEVDGFNLTEGDIIGLNEKQILAKGENIAETVEKLIEKQMDEDTINITLFYGADVKEEDANALCESLQAKYEDCEISVIFGGQPVYYYLISIQ